MGTDLVKGSRGTTVEITGGEETRRCKEEEKGEFSSILYWKALVIPSVVLVPSVTALF